MIDTFKKLAENLSDKQKAEYYAILHELEINPKADMELARLLQVLQLYKAHYETIPEAIQRASTDILKSVQKTVDSIDQLLAGVKTEGEKVITGVKREGERVISEIRRLAMATEQGVPLRNAERFFGEFFAFVFRLYTGKKLELRFVLFFSTNTV